VVVNTAGIDLILGVIQKAGPVFRVTWRESQAESESHGHDCIMMAACVIHHFAIGALEYGPKHAGSALRDFRGSPTVPGECTERLPITQSRI
jgi:hypothetical protein